MPASTSPYQAFSKDFASYQEVNAQAGPSKATVHLDSQLPQDVVLGEDSGLVTALMKSLEDLISSRETSGWEGEDAMTPDEKDALLKEHRTWQLFRTVYNNRLYRSDTSFVPSSAAAQLARNPYIAPEDLMQYMVDEDDELSLYATLVEHLQSRPLLNTSPPLEARHGYLPSTLRRAKASKAAGQPTPASLDPDFTLRDPHGTGLAGEDLTYENPLLETLWDLVRHGELDRAIEVCEQGGEPWRAATLMGGRRWNMPGLTSDTLEETGGLEGNRKRALWKKSCRAMAKNPTLPAAERQLYAALISDLPNLYQALDTWEDLLWANVQYKMEAKLERRWRELGGFWQEEDSLLGEDGEFAGISAGGMDDIFAAIGAVQKHEVQSAKRDPYIVAQKMIILGRTDALLDQFVDLLGQIQETVAEELVGPLVRFYAHLVLALRILGESVPDAAANAIIQAYLKVLEMEGNDHLVAAYAACLRQGSGEESYARFLRSMDSNATKEARREALLRARQHNLDVSVIAKETVRMVLENAFADIPALSRTQPDVASLATGLDERDVYLIRAIEWLTFLSETADEALIKSNAVARYFLALGQAGAAQALFRTLPANFHHAFDQGESEREEYEDYQLLFGVFACHDLVDEVLSRRPKDTASKLEHHNWSKNLAVAVDRVHDSTVHLLTNDWLRFPIAKSESNVERKLELRRIRQIFIPDLVMRLHGLLMTHRPAFPVLLQKSLDLTKTVASEEYGVYAEFLGLENDTGRLVAYLEKVREASLISLELNSSGS